MSCKIVAALAKLSLGKKKAVNFQTPIVCSYLEWTTGDISEPAPKWDNCFNLLT